ncbi:hypothetical protein M0R45_028995 [Rubus argutus]|uniref:CBM20 domain-containing protein n=1 Tax=Rubus argutus TaxID=59490 RepID=A0AAW1W915_RUBAR
MKTLASPSSSVVFQIYRDTEAVLVNRAEQACFFRPHKKHGDFRFLNLVAFLQRRKPVKPVVCLSSKTQAELETTDAQIQEAYPTKTMHVKFQLQKECSFGQQFLIVGDDPMLGLWDPSSAIPMDWSDGNVWSVQLDIPVGKSIQFKFILKGSAGNILWQPGPDRIFHTWDTKNTITVFEDWGDAELQKITEEEQGYNQIEDSNVNTDMLIAEAENLTYPKAEEAVFNMDMEPAIIDSYTDPAQIPLMEPYQEQIVADNISVPQEKPKTIVAENRTPKWSKQMMEQYEEQMVARTTVLDEERIVFPSADSAAISNDMTVADNIFGNNGRPATSRNLTSSDIEGSLINCEEEGPVLVPGLTRAPAVPTEEANKEEVEKPMTFDGSVGAYEAKELNMPELEEKQELYSEPPQAETIDMLNYNEENFDELEQKPRPAEKAEQSESDLQNGPRLAERTDLLDNNEVNFDEELKQKPQPAETAEESDSEPIRDVLNSDMQWGRKMLQKLLFNFRLP